VNNLPFYPQPKPEKQEKKKKTGLKKMKPYEKKLPQQKKKKVPKKKAVINAERQGEKIPSASVRNSFSEEQREKALREFGTVCNDPTCSIPASELHHIIFRSQSGRGVWRNAVPLCISHHEKCHKDRRYSEMWRNYRKSIFGEYYFMDKWDLWLMGLIADTKDHYFEDFMMNQERSATNAAKEISSRKRRRHLPSFKHFGQEGTDPNFK
jgi:5-methylcytosine-specific restriction endonuclease McrA